MTTAAEAVDGNGWSSTLMSPRPSAALSVAGYRQAGVQQQAVELPHPAATLLIQLGDPVEVGSAESRCAARVILIGLLEQPIATRSEGDIDCIEIRLSPPTTFRLLGGEPMHEFAGRAIDLEVPLGPPARIVVEQTASLSEWPTRFASACHLLKPVENDRFTPQPEVREAWEMLVASHGKTPVHELCEATGWSAKRLRQRFTRHIGITPKRAARLIRFSAARRRLAEGATLATTAAECGFVDQSHLHRDVMSFAACTPTELSRQTGP